MSRKRHHSSATKISQLREECNNGVISVEHRRRRHRHRQRHGATRNNGKNPDNGENDINGKNKIGMDGRMSNRFPELPKSLCLFLCQSFFYGHFAYRHWRMSCTRWEVETEHLSEHLSTHALCFYRCAPCSTVFHTYTSSNAPALAQGLRIRVSM